MLFLFLTPFQCSNISIDAFQSIKRIFVWATNFVHGGPIENAKIILTTRDSQSENVTNVRKSIVETPGTVACSNKEGVAVLDHPTGVYESLIVQQGKDISFIENVSSLLRGNSFRKLLWHLFDGKEKS